MKTTGKARFPHKYLKRQWDHVRQEWIYEYPEEAVLPGSSNHWGTDMDENAMSWRGQQRNEARNEEELAAELKQMSPGRKKLPDLGDDEDDKKFLEGFEEGYKLAKEVDREEVGEEET